jgi:hypothetical protein
MSDVHLAKIASIQRSVLRACESAIDLAVLASIIGKDLDDLVRFSEWAARSL